MVLKGFELFIQAFLADLDQVLVWRPLWISPPFHTCSHAQAMSEIYISNETIKSTSSGTTDCLRFNI
jgi:hypothetical protein